MSSNTQSTQVAIVGGGPGGYAAAFMAADLGLKVTLINVDPNPGGTCLYRGCVGSKALRHIAKVISNARDAARYGIQFAPPVIDALQLRAGLHALVARTTDGFAQRCRERGIEYVQARASFLDSQTLKVVQDSGSESTLRFDQAIVASGSRPALPEKLLLDSPRVMTSTTALEMDDLPISLLVVGGGYVGLELGSAYAALGSKVTIVEKAPHLLQYVDTDLAAPLVTHLSEVMHNILTGSEVAALKETGNGIQVTFSNGQEQVFDKVLLCAGRKPNSSGLGLRSTKVEVDKEGFVVVDPQCRTTDPSIFAVGDLTGQPMLAHKALHEGRVAAQVIAGQPVNVGTHTAPAVLFTDPEIAWCGLTETQAASEGRTVKIARFPWDDTGREANLGADAKQQADAKQADGLIKILIDPNTEHVLGVGMVGSNAGSLIADGVLAVERGASLEDISLLTHPYPAFGASAVASADVIFGGVSGK